MPTSESISKLTAALAQAQSEFKPVPKSKTGQEGNRRFKYADLADVVNMITPILNKNGIFLSQPITLDTNGSLRQTTRLQLGEEFIQTDGIKLSEDTPGKNLGISVTYARRIDLNGLLGIAPDEDVDAPDLSPQQTQSAQSSQTAQTAQTSPRTVAMSPALGTPYTKLPNAVSEVLTPEQQKTFGRQTQPSPVVTDEDLPSFATEIPENPTPLADDLREVADELIGRPTKESKEFVPLTKERNSEIQSQLQSWVKSKTLPIRSLNSYLERVHNGKKQFDVSATQWESTFSAISEAVQLGPEAVKNLLKG